MAQSLLEKHGKSQSSGGTQRGGTGALKGGTAQRLPRKGGKSGAVTASRPRLNGKQHTYTHIHKTGVATASLSQCAKCYK